MTASRSFQDTDRLLKVSNLSVNLDGRRILQNLSFDLKKKETLVILGPNGSGKTVLLRALLNLIPHQGDVVWWDGLRLGYVPQRVPLNKDLPITVEDFFALKKIPGDLATMLLRQVGLTSPGVLNSQVGLLSSGQFQRVLIAWALAREPEVLILDEPTSGVDVGGEETIHSLLQKARRERDLALILVTHDLSTVFMEATNVLCINKTVHCYGPPQEVLDQARLRDLYGGGVKYFRHAQD